MVHFVRCFQSNNDYYLAMEDGGHSLFEFTQSAHQCIEAGQLSIAEWHKMVKVIFKQMVECVEYIHSKNVCHFDISIENFLLNEVEIEYENEGKQIKFCHDKIIQTKLCDFGLSKYFHNADFMSSKYCGKRQYRSPEVVERKKPFDAAKNDIFSLGVCLFMMISGGNPWNAASKNDQCFMEIVNGNLSPLLTAWKKEKYVNEDLMELFDGFFQFEADRIDIDGIKKSSWFNN